MSEQPQTQKRGRIRPQHVVIFFGCAIAVFTVLSGLASQVFGFHGDSPIHREVFGNIPDVLRLAFYVVIPVVIIVGSIAFGNRMKNWERGAPENRKTTPANVKGRLERFRSGVYMQTLLRDPAAGIMHSMIYFGFLILLAVTTTLEIDHQMPDDLKFLHGGVYKAYSLVGDVGGIVFLVGIVWAMLRRWGPKSMRPYRIRIKTKPEHAIILGTFLVIGVTGFGAEAFRIALNGEEMGGLPSYERWSIVGYPLARLVEGAGSLSAWHQAWWITHVLAFIVFLIILPTTMLRHMFTSPLNMYLSPRDRPKGAMKPMPNLMETELETFGAATVGDFTWKQLLDTDACTMCGRCTSVCPAHATGKPLDPREIVLKTGEVMAASGSPVVTPPLGTDAEITVSSDSLFERITSEEIWSCTSCKACDENCPVNIEILDKILDMRRYLSLMESDFPSELGGAYRSMENSSNPWGMSQGERADWADALPGITIIDGGDPFEAEFLYWVGCAGSFDDKNKKVSAAFAKLMQRAGVDFAILGPSELCTGDPARRTGNEYIFQMLAMQNIETLNEMGVKRIVTQCPHCFNTLGNEYPQLGGHYEVVHHSQLLEILIADGRLDMANATLEDRLVYHDACYLGRHNDVYLSPRNVVGSIGGLDVVEANRSGTKGMCCGGGGGRMWMEEHLGKQVNVERSQELIATGASRIATACPFCYVMIDDGVKGEGFEEDQVRVADIAIHVLEALENGDKKETAVQLVPMAQRVTAEVIEPPLGYGLPGSPQRDLGMGAAPPVAVATRVEPKSAQVLASSATAAAASVVKDGATEGASATEPSVVEPSVVEPSVVKDDAIKQDDATEGASAAGAAVAGAASTSATESSVVKDDAMKQSDAIKQGDASQAGPLPEAPDGADDNLARIKGTDPIVIKKLHELGVRSYDQIARLDSDQVAWLEQELDIPGRISHWAWVEQAQQLLG